MWTTTAGMHICHNLLTKHYQPNMSAQDCSEQSCAIAAAISQASCFVHCLQTALSLKGCTLLCHHRIAHCSVVTGLDQQWAECIVAMCSINFYTQSLVAMRSVHFDTQSAGKGEEIPLVKAAKTVFDNSTPAFWSLAAMIAPAFMLPPIRLLARAFPGQNMTESREAFETLYDASDALIEVLLRSALHACAVCKPHPSQASQAHL